MAELPTVQVTVEAPWEAKIEFLLKQINTQGGHIVLLTFFVVVGVLMLVFKVPKGEDVIMGALGGLYVALRPAKAGE